MNRKRWIGGGTGVALIVVAAAVWFLFLSGDAPDAVSTEAGLEQLEEDLALTAGEPDGADEADGADGADGVDEPDEADGADEPDEPDEPDEADGADEPDEASVDLVDGTWTVDDEFGSFDFETASGSFGGFRVDEELTLGSTVAVGRSGGVTGSLTITDGTLAAARVTIDMTTIVSDRSRRERAIRDAVGSGEFPTATFVLSRPVALDADALRAGATVTIDAVGELTVKGITNEVTFAIEATLAESGVGLVIGSAPVVWDDFGIDPPSASIVVSVADDGIVEFQLVVTQG